MNQLMCLVFVWMVGVIAIVVNVIVSVFLFVFVSVSAFAVVHVVGDKVWNLMANWVNENCVYTSEKVLVMMIAFVDVEVEVGFVERVVVLECGEGKAAGKELQCGVGNLLNIFRCRLHPLDEKESRSGGQNLS